MKRDDLRQFAGFVLFVLTSLALGLISAEWMTRREIDFNTLHSGPWRAALQAAADPDPYTRARLARSGGAALALSEGLRLTATVDDDGHSLQSECHYKISGQGMPGRYWTLTLADISSQSAGDAAHRTGFTSSEVLRDHAGTWSVELGRDVRAGFFLPLTDDGPFTLVLHLYEPSVLGGAAAISREQLPHIQKETCA